MDTASYSSVRSTLRQGVLPDAAGVRIEELVNYFDYDYRAPRGDVPFSITAEVGECPWNSEHQLVHVGLGGKHIADQDVPARNLVFLVDVSGSMTAANKLPLVKHSLSVLTRTLRAEDRISIVTYAGQAGTLLPSTSGADKGQIFDALSRLISGGGTNGAAGIEQAYLLAKEGFIEGGVNRVILATDGDFNIGISDHDTLLDLIERKRETGVFLSVLGCGMGRSDHTMEQLADKGNGNYAYIDDMNEARKVLGEEAGATLVTIAKDVKIQVEFDRARVKRYRLIGYENRRLAHRDFDDDTKDAGEIGAGHTVTAIYEVVPKREASSDRWMTLNLRYKEPGGDRSRKLSMPIATEARSLSRTSETFRFSAAVASFGMLLRNSPHKGDATYAQTRDLALGALGEDSMCRRHELAELVAEAGMLAHEPGMKTLKHDCRPGQARDPAPEIEVEPTPVVKPVPVLEPAPKVEPTPEPVAEPVGPVVVDVRITDATEDADDTGALVLDVLRLLPPLLALPLFIMAFWRPRRRR